MKSKIRLGVNIDHIATLRQVRGGSTSYPNLMMHAKAAVRAGAQQITIHLREDRRHIQLHDLQQFSQHRPAPLNLEMAATDQMLRLAKKYRPDWCCFVPEKREELTTEGGLDVAKAQAKISAMVEKLQRIGIEISMFIEPSAKQVTAAFDVGADAIELHTGKWVLLKGPAKKREWERLCEAAKLAHHLGLGVHAGHGLDLVHARMIRRLPNLREVNIGHSLICSALEAGLATAVRQMKRSLSSP